MQEAEVRETRTTQSHPDETRAQKRIERQPNRKEVAMRIRRASIYLSAMFALLIGLELASVPQLHPQGFFGSVVGTVTDASGAIIPGATVTLTNVGTNEKHVANANSSGDYQFVNL